MRNNPMSVEKKRATDLLAANKIQQAKDVFEQICHGEPGDIEAWIYLVQINAQLGRPAEVARCCRAIIAVLPNSEEAHYHLGCAELLQSKFDDAAAAFREVLQLKPDHAMAIFHLGKSLRFLGRFAEALPCFQKTVELEPNLAEAYDALGGTLLHYCRIEDAVSAYQKALRLRPDFHMTRGDMLFAMNYSSDYDDETIFSEHVRWGGTHKLQTRTSSQHRNIPDPDRQLRIGYISPDMCTHSVAFFFEPLLAEHDRTRIETYCYADVAEADDTTQRLMSYARHWRVIHAMSDQQVIEKIQSDRIDILVDLSGHTARSRILALTAKPAPIQVNYLGYPNTTGVPAIDYRFTDAWADPPGLTERHHTETLVRLPHGFLCYRPPADAPAVSLPPVQRAGHITFGSFNNLAKVTRQVVALWAAMLEAVPDSRLILKCSLFDEPPVRERYAELFATHGIAAHRLDLVPRIDTTAGHLAFYDQIDIALDTFPYNGTTTTCEALWMGVPVITLTGHRHVGRVGTSLLSQVGLGELIADTPEKYRQIGISLAGDIEKLAALRTSLRQQMGKSSLCDAKNFASDVEHAYREMWRKWCSERGE